MNESATFHDKEEYIARTTMRSVDKDEAWFKDEPNLNQAKVVTNQNKIV